jgi:hypothetical protein
MTRILTGIPIFSKELSRRRRRSFVEAPELTPPAAFDIYLW